MITDHEKQILTIFDSISGRYDLLNRIISFGCHQSWRRTATSQVNIQPGYFILDLCCGTCDWSIELADFVGPSGKVVGLDFSTEMLKLGAKKIKESKKRNISLVLANAINIPFVDNTFDVVTVAYGLRNVENCRQVLGEIYRVLKPKGSIVCLETSQPTMLPARILFRIYFRLIMPVIGKIVSNNYAAYAWLSKSTFAFSEKSKLALWFEQAGFQQVRIKQLCGGVAALYSGRKG